MSTDKIPMTPGAPENSLDRLRERIRARLRELGISAREASRRAGFNVGYVGDLLEGRSKAPEIDRIVRLAAALEIPFADLLDGHDPLRPVQSHTISQELSDQSLSTVPIYAAVSPVNKPFVPFRPDPIGYVAVLPSLRLVRDAYAVQVFNDLCSPRYFPGETVYVSPVEPIRPGDFVFGRRQGGDAGIARFIRYTDSGILFHILNTPSGPDEIERPSDGLVLHRIVGSVG